MSLNIQRIEITVPPPVDGVNAYVVLDDPICVIDPGLRAKTTADQLRQGLARLEVQPEDVRLVLFTHGHQDHYSLAPELFNCPFFVHEADYPKICGSYKEDFLKLLPKLGGFYQRVGMPKEIARDLCDGLRFGLNGYYSKCDGDVRFLQDGDEVAFNGGVLQVIHTPGHSAGSVCFFDPDSGRLLSGDHILSRPIPNPVLDITRDETFNQLNGLGQIYESLERLSRLDLTSIHPGHGPGSDAADKVLEGYRRHFERNKRGILRHLEKGPATPFEICNRLYRRSGLVVYMGISIVLGLLQIMADNGEVTLQEDKECMVFALK